MEPFVCGAGGPGPWHGFQCVSIPLHSGQGDILAVFSDISPCGLGAKVLI